MTGPIRFPSGGAPSGAAVPPAGRSLAQGFTDDYEIEPVGPSGKPLTKTAQIRMCGNSVCPPLAAAIVRAQFSEAA